MNEDFAMTENIISSSSKPLSETAAPLLVPSDAERLKNVTRHAAEFIANFEVAESKMDEWERKLYQQEERVQQQLKDIHEATEELRSIMTEAGAARWRISAEQALSLGHEHIETLKALSEEQIKLQRERNEHFMRLAKKTFERLDRASEHAIKNIKESIDAFNPVEMKQIADRNREALESTSAHAITAIQKLHQWFHWKSLGLAAALTIFASITLGLYINDELPWEVHEQVALQRNAGEALINAWPTLSQAERESILRHNKEQAFT